MIVGGRFDRVENSARTVQYNRKNVFAFDATTGAVSPAFDPNVDGQVWSVLGNGDDVYIAGEFSNVNGVARPRVAKLSLSTGQLDPDFKPEDRRRSDHRPRALPWAAVHVRRLQQEAAGGQPRYRCRELVLQQRVVHRAAPVHDAHRGLPVRRQPRRPAPRLRSATSRRSTALSQYRVAMVDLGANVRHSLVMALRALGRQLSRGDDPDLPVLHQGRRLLAEQPVLHAWPRPEATESATTCSG